MTEIKCFHCDTLLILNIESDIKVDDKKIGTKYKDYDLCMICKENLVNFGFLGDIDNPTIEYEKEKVILDKSKLLKSKSRKKKK